MSAVGDDGAEKTPLFKAVATSTKQLHQVLKCINFTRNNKVHVQIAKESIRFSAEYSRTMQGVADLSSSLFSSFELNIPKDKEDMIEVALPRFQISLSALLEVLQIFGVSEMPNRWAKEGIEGTTHYYRADAFNNQTVGIGGSTCTIIYEEEGARLNLFMEEANMKTKCSLATYLPENEDDIPFDRNDISFKIIMFSRYMYDALAELAPSGPDRTTFVVTDRKPYFSVSSTGTTNLGSTSVDFSKAKDLLETFTFGNRWVQSFKFQMLKYATEAMRISQKVSLRGDGQGVLKAQFLIPLEGAHGLGPCFLDFTFVPCIELDDDDEDTMDGAEMAIEEEWEL